MMEIVWRNPDQPMHATEAGEGKLFLLRPDVQEDEDAHESDEFVSQTQ